MAKNKKVNEGLADQAASAEADHELQMARSQLYKIAQYSIKLHEMMKQVTDPNGIEAWQAAKITKAADYMGAVYHDLEYKIKFEQEGGELGAAGPGEIAVGETKKYGKFKETSDPYVQSLRSKLDAKKKDSIVEASRDYDSYGTFTGGRSRPGGKPSARDRGIDDDGDQAFVDRQKAKKASPYYLAINDKVWWKNGQAVEFKDAQAASNAGHKIIKNNPKLSGDNVKLTRNPNLGHK
jgi:hypothetical protein